MRSSIVEHGAVRTAATESLVESNENWRCTRLTEPGAHASHSPREQPHGRRRLARNTHSAPVRRNLMRLTVAEFVGHTLAWHLINVPTKWRLGSAAFCSCEGASPAGAASRARRGGAVDSVGARRLMAAAGAGCFATGWDEYDRGCGVVVAGTVAAPEPWPGDPLVWPPVDGGRVGDACAVVWLWPADAPPWCASPAWPLPKLSPGPALAPPAFAAAAFAAAANVRVPFAAAAASAALVTSPPADVGGDRRVAVPALAAAL